MEVNGVSTNIYNILPIFGKRGKLEWGVWYKR